MSYILDALKKIEHEKNKKHQPAGRISVADDLFQEKKQPAGRTGFWKMALLVATVSLVTCGATWFMLRSPGKKSGPATALPSAAPPVAASPPIAAAPVPLSAAPQPAPLPVAAPVLLAAPVKKTVVMADKQVARVKPQSMPLPRQSLPIIQAPVDIKLSGIAWQDERSSRRAVINGFLLKEGTVVSGAKITDILTDRVRFQTSTGQFEIKLDAVLPAEVQR